MDYGWRALIMVGTSVLVYGSFIVIALHCFCTFLGTHDPLF